MDSKIHPINAVPSLIGLLIYYLALKIWWGLPGPDWGYLNHIDTFLVNVFRAALYTLPSIGILFYFRNQRTKELQELRTWEEDISRLNRRTKNEIQEILDSFAKEIIELKKAKELKPESVEVVPTKTEAIQGFNIQEFLEP